MDKTQRLKNQVKNLLEVLDYFEDFRFDFEVDEKTAFIEKFGEILVDNGVIDDTYTDKNRRKLKKEWENLELRTTKLAGLMFPLNIQYFGKDGKKRSNKEPNFRDTLELDYYNKTQAAKALDISRPTLDNWLREKYFGLKTIKRGVKDAITKREMVRFHKLYSSK